MTGATARPRNKPEAEQQRDRELLAAAARGDIEPEDARERGDEEQQPSAAAQVAADIRAEGGKAAGHGHEAHDLTKHRARTVARDRAGTAERVFV